ncbi:MULTISPECIES: trigger factor [Paraclostridium]|uniref:Trigger factor n=1 Tax=Paraclostridium bifermentans TaxID=1490 RepID=A0AA44IHR5_PARBF|nr:MULTISPECIES: trigger factor [Paraclostridium]MDV8111778.1 trigger factor [Bacillus sp. BAU-SS-2023]EQK44938.1 trigger factor [[Clostridium] bifermentans ATCC 19299] [Paraclostridium bifermentans ATCC 19299]MBN8048115.1 trigger factor [Paraclostridium bifermentans]MBZ6005427.1 trigger factor [Paraclostridium bifermentans]MCE9676094.1 trigger factor [Paraclostridium bifermentans]
MKAELLKKEGNKVTFKLTVDNDKFEGAVTKAYNKNKGKFNIPGFRKGKAPKQIIESQYGKGVFYNDAIDMLFPEIYPSALDELNIDPIDRPDLDIEEISKDNGLVMVVNVEVKPEFELGSYKGIEIAKPDYTVNEDEVTLRLDEMRNKASRLVDVEGRAIENGDNTVIDFEGFVDGVAFEGGKGEDYSLVIGSNTFIPGFEEQLIGKNKGEEVEVNVEFPAEYHAENLAGKPATFKVVIKNVQSKELPELNDEFAADTTEFNTLEELKSDLKAKVEEEAKNRADAEMRNSLVEKISEGTEVEVPNAMVETQIDNMLMELNYQLQYQGLQLEQLLQMTGRSIEDLRNEKREEATKLVKSSLVLEAIAKAENVEVSEADVEAEVEKMAKMYNMEVEKIKSVMRPTDLEDIKGQLKIRKTIDSLVDSAKLV